LFRVAKQTPGGAGGSHISFAFFAIIVRTIAHQTAVQCQRFVKPLETSPDEQKAFQCKTAALIHLGKFEDCLHHLKPSRSKFGVEQKFERAYCEYRLNRLAEALASLENCDSLRDQELRAQVLYRLERFNESLALYRSLVRNCADDYGEEREANMAAACAARCLFGDSEQLNDAEEDEAIKLLARDTYDQLYNVACALIGRGRLDRSGRDAERSERTCREALAEDDQETLMEELAPIQFQQAYLAQHPGADSWPPSWLAEATPGGASGGGGVNASATNYLESLCAQQPDLVQTRIALAQLFAQAGSPRQACEALKQLPPDLLFSDRIVSAVMRFFLADARRHYSETEPDDEKHKILLKLSARFEQSGGNYPAAAALYSELLQLTPNDQRLIASLVHAYAQFDPPKAEETFAPIERDRFPAGSH
uniref:Signal recognition particle subunit SRP72 n=1 Tax=Macrostomum lignano TaxID=282301 RepID=A0A1I8FJ88_9PLAT